MTDITRLQTGAFVVDFARRGEGRHSSHCLREDAAWMDAHYELSAACLLINKYDTLNININ